MKLDTFIYVSFGGISIHTFIEICLPYMWSCSYAEVGQSSNTLRYGDSLNYCFDNNETV